MAQTDIKNHDHVGRRASRSHQVINPSTKAFEGLSQTFFELRHKDGETTLSCFWLEYFPGTTTQQIKSLRAAIKKKMSGESEVMKIIIMNVEQLKKIAEDHGVRIRVHTAGQRLHPAYSYISGMPRTNQDTDLLIAMAADAMKDAVPYMD